jgi:hypothetical protein
MAQSKKPFVTLIIDEDLLKRIEDYRFKHRFQSRAAAMKWLLSWALDQKPKPPPPTQITTD